MLRLNRFIISKHLKRVSNVSLKSSHYYSSEPPDKVLTIRLSSPSDQNPERLEGDISEPFFRTTTSELNLFGPHDMRAPLNGNIGLGFEDRRRLEAHALLKQIRNTTAIERIQQISKSGQISLVDIQSIIPDSHQNRCNKFFRILKYQRLFPQEMVSVSEMSDTIDFSAHDLPFRVVNKFATLFPSTKRREFSDGLTAVTLTKKTINDMTAYSEDIELEREKFFEQFISNAKSICAELLKNGFWADFIDPYSGHPFLSEPTNETLFETDDRFRHLGFKIEDLGCCKAIHHNKWASHVIVGTLFTTAPANSLALKKLMTDAVNKDIKTV